MSQNKKPVIKTKPLSTEMVEYKNQAREPHTTKGYGYEKAEVFTWEQVILRGPYSIKDFI